MAHFAKIENGVVTQVIVVDNKDTADAFGVEKEHIGAAFCERVLGGRRTDRLVCHRMIGVEEVLTIVALTTGSAASVDKGRDLIFPERSAGAGEFVGETFRVESGF